MRRSLPRLPRHVLRLPEVADLLERWAPITVVRGLQGYGKTTAVGAWIADQPSDVLSIWISARDFQDDPASIGHRVEHELSRAGLSGLGGTGSADDADHLQDPMAALDRVAGAHADERLVVVIDDADALREDRTVQCLVDLATRHHNVHLVMCSRGPHHVERLAAGAVEVVVVPAQALLMSAEQILELARQMEAPLTVEQARQLHDMFGGWAAAVQLVLGRVTAPVAHLPLGRAADYVRDTVLPQIGDQRMLHQVARYALAERLTHDVIRDLADDGDEPEALVRMVEAPGLAERSYEGTDVVLELPSFVKASLRQLFVAQQPAAAQDMDERLAHWYATHDGPKHPLYALHHAVAADDWELVDLLWTRHSVRLVVLWPGDVGTILRRIPEPVIASRPGIRIAREMTRTSSAEGGSHLDGRVVGRTAYIEASRQLAQPGLGSLSAHDLLYVGTGHMIALRSEGRLAEASAVGDELEAAAAALTAAGQDAGDRLPTFHLQRGLTHTLLDEHPAAIHRYHLAWRTRHHAVTQVGACAAANLAVTHVLVGDPRVSARWLDHHASLHLQPSWADAFVNAGAHLAAALIALDRLDADGCSSALERLSSSSMDLELGPLIDYLQAQHHLHFGSPAAGLGILDAALSARPEPHVSPPVAAGLLIPARAELLLAAGQAQRARSLLGEHIAPLEPRSAVVSARISILSGDPLAASRLASNLIWGTTIDNRTRQDLLVLHALAAHRLGDLQTSADMTRQALALYRSTRILRSFAAVAPDDLDALLGIAGATLPPQDLATLHRHPSPYPARVEIVTLTPRERLLAAALSSSSSRQEIADQLYVSVNTVRSQLATLYRKLDVSTRDQALVRLVTYGLVQDPPTWSPGRS